jgi:PAS domain S-box-containing protein
MAGSISDITEQKRAQAALRDSEAGLANAQRIANLGNWDWNIVTGELRWSDQIYRIFGLKPQQFGATYEAFLQSVHPDDREMVKVAVSRALDEREPYAIDHRIVLPDGEERIVHEQGEVTFDASGKPLRMTGTVQDITKRKRAEVELRQSEARYHAVVEDQPEMISRHRPDGTRTFVNGAYCRFHGKSAEELIGQSAYEGMEPADLERLHTLYAGLTPEDPVGEFEVSFTGPDGDEIWQRWTKRAIYDASGQVSEYQAVGRDITEQKRAEAAIRQLNETLERRVEERTSELRAAQGELLRQERLATLGRLTATVSHELRNPLGVIRTSAYTLRADLNLETPRAVRSLERVERSVVRCDRIIEELLDFTRISGLEPEPTALDVWLDGVLEEQVLPEGIVLYRDFDLPGSTVAFDHDRFRRAVINVFENACQTMLAERESGPANGEHALTVRTQARAGRVEVVFEDQGPGIPEEVYGRIYEPLFSTKGFGVGLGLPVVKQIMEQHGGGVEVETEEGHGTTVRLWLDPKANLKGVAA